MYKITWKQNKSTKAQKYEGFIQRGTMQICIAIITKKGKSWNVDWTTDKVEDSLHKSLQIAKDFVFTLFNKSN